MPRFLTWLVAVIATAPAAAADTPLSKIAFGSCADQNKPCPIWATIAAAKPDLVLLLGDNIYADLEDGKLKPADPEKIARSYAALAAVPEWQQLKAASPILATWDDHDFGHNDAGVEWEYKDAAQKLFLDFFGVPADSHRRTRKGVYHAETFGPVGKQVQIILLDGRYFRSPYKKGPRGPQPGYTGMITPYLPSNNPTDTMLGDAQWKWLEEQLRQPAALRLICSGIQVISNDHPFEKWGNFPAEREKLYRLIRETQANGVVLLSGDRHLGELSVATDAVGYPLYDLTASGLNQASKTWRGPEKNTARVAGMPYGDHFGMIQIDWTKADPIVGLQLRDATGEITLRQTFPISLLQAKGDKKDEKPKDEKPKDKPKLPEGVLTPADAIKKVGEEVTVQFEVVAGREVSGGKRILLNSEVDFKSEKNLTVVVNEKAQVGRWEKSGIATFKGKTIRAKGKVTKYMDRPQIEINDEKAIEIVDDKKDDKKDKQ